MSVCAGTGAEWAGRWAEGEGVAGEGKRPRAWAGFGPARGEEGFSFSFYFPISISIFISFFF